MRLSSRLPRFANQLFGSKFRRLGTRATRLGLLRFEDKIAPATITVSTASDTSVVDGAVSLREALDSINTGANANADVVPVGAYGTADSITFSNATFAGGATIKLGGTQLSILNAVVIDNSPLGSGKITIDADNLSRVFNIDAVGGFSSVEIKGLTLTKGSTTTSGGCIAMGDDIVTLTDVIVTGNKTTAEAGGINVSTTTGMLFLVNSTISKNSCTGGDGGAIQFAATAASNANLVLDLVNSTVDGNTAADDGGGVYFFSGGTLKSVNSSWVNNSSGGGNGGAGIYLFANVANIDNCTISSNKVTGAGPGAGIASLAGSVVTIRNSTIAFNQVTSGSGGNIHNNNSSLNLYSTIVSDGVAVTAPDINTNAAVGATFTLVSNDTGSMIIGDPSNVLNMPSGLNPTLALNGGTTLNHSLKTGSKAIDFGDNTSGAFAKDQTGVQPRTFDDPASPNGTGDKTDIGSFEYQGAGAAPIVSTASAPAVTTPGNADEIVTITYTDDVSVNAGTIDDNDIKLKSPSGTFFSTTKVTAGPSGASVTATYKLNRTWSITDVGIWTIEMQGSEVSDFVPNSVAAGTVGSFKVSMPASLLTVDNKGDGIDFDYSANQLTFREAVGIANANAGQNDTIAFSAGVFNAPTTIVVGSEMKINEGVKIVGPAQALTLDGNDLVRVMSINDSAVGDLVDIANLTLTKGNSGAGQGASDRGGALRIVGESVNLTNVNVTNSKTNSGGGGIAILGNGTITLTNCTVSGNKATGKVGQFSEDGTGGGINVSSSNTVSLILIRSTVSGNTAAEDGGGIYLYFGGNLDLTESTISNNSADGFSGGGGVYAYAATVNITNSTISGNKSTSSNANFGGGGIFLRNNSSLNMRNSTVAFNEAAGAGGNGGNLSSSQASGAVTIYSSILSNGKAAVAGPDISNTAAITATFTLVGNDAGSVITADASNKLNVDPLLDPVMALNHGATVATHALKVGSPAVDQGDSTVFPVATDQTGKGRIVDNAGVANSSDGTDIGAMEAQIPTVQSIIWQNSDIQRSMVTTGKVTFNESTVALAAGALTLERYANGTLGTVGLNIVQSGLDFILTFKAGTIAVDPAGSLADGTYKLTVDASKVSGAAGLMVGNVESKVHRLFGDANGSGNVDGTDFVTFRGSFGISPVNPIFDYFGVGAGGQLGGTEFAEFRKRFGLGGYLP